MARTLFEAKLLTADDAWQEARLSMEANRPRAVKAAVALVSAPLADTVAQRVSSMGGHLTEYIEPVAMGIMAWAPSLLLAPFLAFFFLRDGQRFEDVGHVCRVQWIQ